MSDDVCANCGCPYSEHVIVPGFCRTGVTEWPQMNYGTSVVGIICPTSIWKPASRATSVTSTPRARRPRAYFPDDD